MCTAYRFAFHVLVENGAVLELSNVSHANAASLLGLRALTDLEILDLEASSKFFNTFGFHCLLLLLGGLLRDRNRLAIFALLLLGLLLLHFLGLLCV